MPDVASNRADGNAATQEGGANPTANLTWPSFYPDRCPPAGATPAGGVVLGLVCNDPSNADDFLPWSIENGRVDKSKPCESCAVSVHETKPTGKTKRTHQSWWLLEGIDPSPVFNVVAPPFQPEGA